MKPSEMLKNTGRVIAYRPNLARLFGGVIAEVFFEQIFYWQDKSDSELGVYKTQEELEIETGLSRKEQETARKLLREKGVLIETYKRLEHRLYYKIDCDKLDELLATLANVQSEHSPMSESDIRECDKVTFVNTLDYNTRLHTNNPLPLNGESANAEHADEKTKTSKRGKISVDYQGVMNAWNEVFNGSPIHLLKTLSPERKKAILKVAKTMLETEDVGSCSVEVFKEYFKDFLNQANSRANKFFFGGLDGNGWVAKFKYIMRPETFLNTFEDSL